MPIDAIPSACTITEGRLGLEFYEPPQCPFFDYPAGAASPYGEQTAALLHRSVLGEEAGWEAMRRSCRNLHPSAPHPTCSVSRHRLLSPPCSLVEAGGLDCCAYAATLFATFGPGFEGYR